MDGYLKIFEKRSGELVFSVVCGIAYWIIVQHLIYSYSPDAMLLGLYFLPALICGSALFLIKAIRSAKETESYTRLKVLFWVHLPLVVVACVFAADMLMG